MKNDPLGLFDDEADPLGLFEADKPKTSFREDNAIAEAGIKNTFTKAGLMGLGAIATALGDTSTADEIYRDMEETTKARMKAANPEDKEQSFGGKAYGVMSTLPAQLLAIPFSPFDTGQTMLENGESLNKARAGVAIDTAGNMIGMGLPAAFGKKLATKAITGAISNSAQDTAVRGSIAGISDTEKSKEDFAPTWETAGLAALPGAAMGALHTKQPKVSKAAEDAKAKQAAIDARKAAEQQPAADPLGLADELRQMELFDLDNQGKAANPYEAQHGTWAVDENGMPVRTDISMEAANLEQPLQRNLWGDELAPRETPRGQSVGLPMDRDIMGHEQLTGQDVSPMARGITQAMDETQHAARTAEDLPTAEAKRAEMDQQLSLLEHDLAADPHLERAKMDADNAGIRNADVGDNFDPNTPRSPYTDPTITKQPKKYDAGKTPDPIRQISPGGRQTGAVNPSLLRWATKGIERIVGDYTFRLDARPWGPEVTIIDKHGNEVGQLSTEAKYRGGEQNLEASFVKVMPEHRGKGLAKTAYEMLRMAGNDIHRSDNQLPDGKAMWDKFEKSGYSQDGLIPRAGRQYVPLKQRGAVGNLNKGKKARTIVDDLRDRFSKEKTMIPDDPSPKDTVAEALQEGKDSNQLKYTESGGTLAAMKRGSALVRDVMRTVQNHVKKAEFLERKMVHPVEKAFRKLSRQEIVDLADIMKTEMTDGRRFDPEALEHLSTNQQVAYAHMRAMFEDTLKIQNEARAAKGQPPITEMEAYLSSRWQGDFRRPVFQTVLDKAGNPIIEKDGSLKRKLVYYLAADSKHGLEKQWKALKKEHPDFEYDPKEDHTIRFYKRQTDLQSTYSTILDILGDDPAQREAVNLITKAVQEQAINEAASFLGQEKHFKEKTGVRGFVGDRPGKAGTTSEALAMFQQQIQYAKNAYKWSEMQKAGQIIKEVVADKDLVKQQPNNVQYAKEYFKQNVGYGESVAMAHLEDSLRSLGFSPHLIDAGVGTMKSFFILQKLAVNSGYAIANLIQTANVIPHLTALHGQGYKGSYLKAIPVGILGGIAMATTHYSTMASKKLNPFAGMKDGGFLKRAYQYMEDNSVASRALYDESPIESSFSVVGQVANKLGKTMSGPEAFVRSMAFMTTAQFLKDSKKFKSDIEMFQKAEEVTNAAMVDYRRGERPMMFEKLGTVGNFLNTLQTYPVNWFNQWNYFGREAAKGNVAPILSAIAIQYAVAGASGIPGFEDMLKLYDLIKDNVLSDTTYAKYRDSDFFTDPKMWMVKNFGQASVYGVLSDKTNLGLTSRVAAPGAGQMLQSPIGPAVDIAKQVGNLGSAILDPTNTTKWGQAAMSSIPPGAQGLLEQAPFMEGNTFDNRTDAQGNTERVYQRPGDLQAHQGIVTRSPRDEMLRNFGLRSQSETLERESGYRYNKNSEVAAQRARSIPDAMYDAAKRKDIDKVKDLYAAYVKLTGNELSQEAWDAQVEQNYYTSREKASKNAKTVTQLMDVARMKDIMEKVRNEYQREGKL